MNGMPDPALLDRLVGQTARYFREREEVVRGLWNSARQSDEKRTES
jgi:hypothetical protein